MKQHIASSASLDTSYIIGETSAAGIPADDSADPASLASIIRDSVFVISMDTDEPMASPPIDESND